ncbi:MAG: nucleotidyltransferase [Oscillospiraceae bacterium]|jgi:NDP-sugar pyrophosphorylase family protein|nr:nucleotidyltransferase [Oscillospiraceae bacterium]
MKPSLVVMAAGMGSRFGGLKQMEPVTGRGEVLLDFSIYDALDAGFESVILIIKRAIERDFEEKVGRRLRRQAGVRYVYQELDDLPDGRRPPEGREKPWGTGQAVLAARGAVDTPFAVINADDYYGKSAFSVMADFLRGGVTASDYAMVGYRLGNTLTEYGAVARGVCEVKDGFLRGLTERTKIIKREGDAAYSEDGENWRALPLDTVVSMQMFGFHPDVFALLDEGFRDFLASPFDPMKGEYLLPARIGELVTGGRVSMRVLDSPDRWFGVTYRQDKPAVVRAITELRERGIYPRSLWGGQ